MTRRWVDRGCLVVAILFLAAAVLLGLVWTDRASAAVNTRVVTGRATDIVFRAERAVWRHNLPRARSFKIRCNFTDVRGSGRARTGKPTDCTFRAYRHTNYVGRIFLLTLDLTVTIRQPDVSFEDGSIWATYSAGRSLHMNPRAPHAVG